MEVEWSIEICKHYKPAGYAIYHTPCEFLCQYSGFVYYESIGTPAECFNCRATPPNYIRFQLALLQGKKIKKMNTSLIIIATSLVIGIPILFTCGIVISAYLISISREIKSISSFLNDPPPLEFRSFGPPGPHKCEHEEEPATKKGNGQYL